MQRRYEKNSVIITETVAEFSTQFPVSVVYEHKNSRPDSWTLHEHISSMLL